MTTSREYSRAISDAIISFMQKDSWKYDFSEEKGTFNFHVNLNGPLKKIDYFVKVNNDSYVVYVYMPIGGDAKNPDSIAAVSEYICRANFGIEPACFEIDPNDGEVRIKKFVDCENIVPTEDIIKNSIYAPLAMFNRFAGGIAKVAFGGVTPAQAVLAGKNISYGDFTEEDKDKNAQAAETMLARLASRLNGGSEN